MCIFNQFIHPFRVYDVKWPWLRLRQSFHLHILKFSHISVTTTTPCLFLYHQPHPVSNPGHISLHFGTHQSTCFSIAITKLFTLLPLCRHNGFCFVLFPGTIKKTGNYINLPLIINKSMGTHIYPKCLSNTYQRQQAVTAREL